MNKLQAAVWLTKRNANSMSKIRYVCVHRERHCGWSGIHTQLPQRLWGLINTYEYLKWLVTTSMHCVGVCVRSACRNLYHAVESSLSWKTMCDSWVRWAGESTLHGLSQWIYMSKTIWMCVSCECMCVVDGSSGGDGCCGGGFSRSRGENSVYVCVLVWECLALHMWAQLTQFRNYMPAGVREPPQKGPDCSDVSPPLSPLTNEAKSFSKVWEGGKNKVSVSLTTHAHPLKFTQLQTSAETKTDWVEMASPSSLSWQI